MVTIAEPLLREGFRSAGERRKRLGQYFTGVKLARLLAALAGAGRAESVIDPMVGSGDMLVGVLAHGAPTLLGGIELDPLALAQCSARLDSTRRTNLALELGSAFSPSVLQRLPVRAWDVVITNPPYVRYQRTSRDAGTRTRIPSALEIREDLVNAIDALHALDDEDRRLFRELAHGYSGLADLAVPAWILCAGLVKIGGTLAMLVPATWMSRDYAHPIRYLLQRWFDVTCVVEDGDASWFTDALVRTTLVVATRVPRRDSAFAFRAEDGYVHLRIDAGDADARSLVGGLFPKAEDPEVALAAVLPKWRRAGEVPHTSRIAAKWVPAQHYAGALRHAAIGTRWLSRLQHLTTGSDGTRSGVASVPSSLLPLIEGSAVEFVTLEGLGWCVGQGLRTGANKFFYLRRVATQHAHELLQPAIGLGECVVKVPNGASIPVLQRQADLPVGYTLCSADLTGRVLVLGGYALPEDLEAHGDAPYIPIPPTLAAHVRRAARTNVGSPEAPKFIPQLSAVVTNARAAMSARPPRFWYQLPRFADRHRPSLLIPRINSNRPRAFVNENRCAVVDANFSTLWPTSEVLVDAHALLAVLNSTWSAAVFEFVGSVMGGGGLKVEAIHIRRMPLPRLSADAWMCMSELGRLLANDDASEEALVKIDLLVFEAMGFTDPMSTRAHVAAVAADHLRARSA